MSRTESSTRTGLARRRLWTPTTLIAALLVVSLGVWWFALADRLTGSQGSETCVPSGPAGEAVFGAHVLENESGGDIVVTGVELVDASGLVLTEVALGSTEIDGGGFVGNDTTLVPDLPLPRAMAPGEQAVLYLVVSSPAEGARAEGSLVHYRDRWGRSGTLVQPARLAVPPAGETCQGQTP